MNSEKNKELDLIEIIKTIYISRILIIKTTILFTLIGIIVALISPTIYSSSTVFIPQNQKSSSSPISGVASLVGINLGGLSYGDEIPTIMYPEIGNSTKFKRLILNEIVDRKSKQTLKEFIIDYYEIKEENLISTSPLSVSKREEKCFEILSEIISIDVNIKDGSVTITTLMPNAEYSALIANSSKEILQKIIIENKIESAKQNLKFSQKQLEEKKLEFDKIQGKLSSFKDSNLNLVNSLILNKQDKLEAEFQIINAVVTELSKQVEEAKLQVTKDTPVFSTIKEAFIPNQRTSPERKKIVITYIIFGFLFSSVYVLTKEPIKKFISEIITN